MSPYQLLGLDETADERQIKRAYAAALRTARPDEDPERFQQINEAYQAALELHLRRGGTVAVSQALPVGETRTGWNSGPITIDPTKPTAAPYLAAMPAPSYVSLPQAVASMIEAASKEGGPQFAQWLTQYAPLYSLEFKAEAAIALMRTLIMNFETRLPADALDAIAEFFDLGGIGNYPEPVRAALQSLRLRSQFDFPTFLTKLRKHRRTPPDLRVWLNSQPYFNDLALRNDTAQRVREWLTADDSFFLEPRCMEVLTEFFGLQDDQLLRDRNLARNVIATENVDFMATRGPIAIRQLKRKFSVLQAFVAAAVPGTAPAVVRIAEFLHDRYHGFHPKISRRQYEFFVELTDSGPWNQLRWTVVALRMAMAFALWLVASLVNLKELALGGSALFAAAVGVISAASIFTGAWGHRHYRLRRGCLRAAPILEP
ncbi:J domain-containing protein [Lysobacter sp. 5GHs7-4]|uniref:J domain-containing protein n=1 Tax=Lysobacter sp. 5GHs7-4 TaxID=2904253 RepID=UPI001E4B1392|nr:J domain-containing protein [Lysobacter sp. 5GHs7-4]UHQ24949.1 J domain-containing protein [Lysobacter sp. 5GHs7-4]